MKKILFILAILPVMLTAQNKINKYQYWFDENYAVAQSNAVSPQTNINLNTAISASVLAPGLHTLHIRFCDDSSRWSSALSRFFFKATNITGTKTNITGWEYWFNNGYASRVSSSLTAAPNAQVNSAISTSSLSNGLNIIHVRFKDSNGEWSSTVSQFFFKSISATPVSANLVAYQYWYDSDYTNAVTQNAGPGQDVHLTAPLPTGGLSDGLHTFHLRFLDSKGVWSSVVSQFFFKSVTATSNAIQLSNYQYWFDNDYSNAVTTSLAPAQSTQLISSVSATSIPNGLHSIHIRLRDNSAKWSTTLTRFFFKSEAAPNFTNKLNAYRYWFDKADSAMINVSVTPSTDVTINNAISMIAIPKGVHTIHLQFKDSTGKWSSTITDTLNKRAFPIASFIATDTLLCDSGNVAFTDHSIDGDVYLWNFGDGNSSTLKNPAHTYTLPGLYSVNLTVTDTATGLDSSVIYTQYVKVFNTPSKQLALSTNDSICSGNSSIITAAANSGYTWNTGAVTQSISVTNSGAYYADVYNLQHPACHRTTDIIHITTMPVPHVFLGNDTSICQGSSLSLNAANVGCTYIWSDNSTNAGLTVNTAGAYWVSVSTAFGCNAKDTIQVNVDPLPSAGFTYSGSGLTFTFTNLSGNASGYLWNFGDGNTSTQASPNYTYTNSGSYLVTLIASNNCDSDTISQNIMVVGINEINNSSSQLHVYPNPANTIITIVYAAKQEENVYIGLYNALGELVSPVLNTEIIAGQLQEAKLDVSQLANGIYYVKMNGNQTRHNIKLVISR